MKFCCPYSELNFFVNLGVCILLYSFNQAQIQEISSWGSNFPKILTSKQKKEKTEEKF